jgi:3-methylfumaryl-CoA hydratase
MTKWAAWIGKTQTQEDILTPALLQRFRATIDSEDAAQGIHWCLCLPETRTADLDSDGHPKRGGFLPPIPLPRRMWASSKVTFHAPIPIAAKISRLSTLANVTEKNGDSGQLIFVDIDHETSANGILVVSERQTLVYREPPSASSAPSPTNTQLDLAQWPHHRIVEPHEALLFRYSALTFNSHRIHYDHPYATKIEGYAGLVVHGPLMATLLLDLGTRTFGAEAIKTFAFRGQAPAIAGERLHVVGKAEGLNVTLAILGAEGRTIMSASATLE